MLISFLKNYKLKKTFLIKIKFFSLAIVLILPAILPLFRQDFFPLHDYTHAARLYEMDQAIQDGHFPVRWSKNLSWGHGMPLFHFYAPLPYYFAEIFYLLGFSFLNAIKICFGATFFLAFLGVYLLAKKFWGQWGGFISALAFVYSPYRAVDFYVRGALGELFAISLIPLGIWAVLELIEKRTFKKVSLGVLIMAGLFLSHTVLTLIAVPTIFIIGLFYILINNHKLKSSIYFLISYVWALGLAAFFLLPAFLERDFTRVADLTGGYSHYSHHFLYFRQFLTGSWGYGGSVGSIPDGMSFHLGKVHLLLAVLTFLAGIYFIIKKSKEKKQYKKILISLFFLGLGIVYAFLTTYNAKPIWDFFPILAYIQFPWRLNSFIIVFLAFLTGGSLFYIKKIFSKKLSTLFFVVVSILIVVVNFRYFRPERYITAADLFYTDEQQIKEKISGVIPDYLPKWIKEENKSISEKEYEIIDANPKQESVSGDATPIIKVVASKTQKLILEANSQTEANLLINRNYFPGWQLRINYKPEKFIIDEKGLVRFSLKRGANYIEWQYQDTLIVRLSNVLSLLSLLILVLNFINFKKLKKLIFWLRQKINRKLLTWILVVLLMVNLISYLIVNRNAYTSPYNHEKFSQYYKNSQYVNPAQENLIIMGDNTLYAFAGTEYLKGINPIEINFEHPPLGKYLIGLSTAFFHNENVIMLVFGVFSLWWLFLITKNLTKNTNLSLFTCLIFSFNSIFKAQLNLSMLDLFQLTGILFSYYMYRLAQTNKVYYWFCGLGIGFAISVKYGLPLLLFVAILIVDQLVNNLKKVKFLILSLALSLLIFLLSYFQYFLQGGSLGSFFKFQNWLLHWYLERVTPHFEATILSTVLLGTYSFEQVDISKIYIYNDLWNITWPITFFLFIGFFINYLLKKLRPKKLFLIYFWPAIYFLSLIKGNSSERYLLIILPFIYLSIIIYLYNHGRLFRANKN